MNTLLADLLGTRRDITDVDALQMAMRTILIYGASLALVRIGSKRFLSQASAFDMIVAIMLGSIMSRAINLSAPMLPTIVAGATLIAIHWVLAALAYRIGWLGPILKGQPVQLIVDGRMDEGAMRHAGVSRHDLEQAMRAQAGLTDPADVRCATLERDGTISILRVERPARVVEVAVADGVQTVRVEIG